MTFLKKLRLSLTINQLFLRHLFKKLHLKNLKQKANLNQHGLRLRNKMKMLKKLKLMISLNSHMSLIMKSTWKTLTLEQHLQSSKKEFSKLSRNPTGKNRWLMNGTMLRTRMSTRNPIKPTNLELLVQPTLPTRATLSVWMKLRQDRINLNSMLALSLAKCVKRRLRTVWQPKLHQKS